MESDSGEPSFIHHVTPRVMAINILDNPVWHALTGPHRVHALGRGKARHYPRDMAPFSAIAEPELRPPMPTSRPICRRAPRRACSGRRSSRCPMAGRRSAAFPCCRWWRRGRRRKRDLSVTALSQADAPAMLDLVAATEPGPFGRRTPLLGRYLGIRHGDRLVAMAGERLRLPGHVELSAICVHPEARGKGYARGAYATADAACLRRRARCRSCMSGRTTRRPSSLLPPPGLRDAPRVGGAMASPDVGDAVARLARRLGGVCRRRVRMGRRLLWTGRLLGGVASLPRLVDRHDLAGDHRAFPGERGPDHRLARRLSPFRRRPVTIGGAVLAAAGAVAWTNAQQIWQLVPALAAERRGMVGDERRGAQPHRRAVVRARPAEGHQHGVQWRQHRRPVVHAVMDGADRPRWACGWPAC